MKKNIALIAVVVALIAFLTWFGLNRLKPGHDRVEKNPYALDLDSVGTISAEKMGAYRHEKLPVPFTNTVAIAVDPADDILASGDSNILIINRKGAEINRFSTSATATALAVDSTYTVFAAFERSVGIYHLNGKLVRRFAVGGANSYLTSIAVRYGRIYVADAGRALVYEYTPEGRLVRTFGSKDKTDEIKAFILPSNYFDVAVATDGTVWIANTGRHKLVGFAPDGTMKRYWGETSSEVEGFCGCCNPSHFTFQRDGSFITAEKGLVRIKQYDAQGNFLKVVAGKDEFQPGAVGLDVTVNSQQEILVLEPQVGTIHLFKEMSHE